MASARHFLKITPALFATSQSLTKHSSSASCDTIDLHLPPPSFDNFISKYQVALNGKKSASGLKRRTTSIGRLAHKTSTTSNPSVVSFVISLSSAPNSALSCSDFSDTFAERILSQRSRFQRFASNLSADGTMFISNGPMLDGDLRNVVTPTSHPTGGQDEAKRIIEDMIYKPLGDVPWGAKVSRGALARSPILTQNKVEKAIRDGREDETLVFFRASHALGDGVSMGAIMGELSDEAEELRGKVKEAMKKRRGKKRKKSLLTKFAAFFKRLFWFVRGLAMIGAQQFRMMIFNSANPFRTLLEVDLPEGKPRRALGWKECITVEDARAVARSMGCSINDMFVACITKAVHKQIREHVAEGNIEDDEETRKGRIRCVIPVHLFGGILLPGQEIGNRIGAVSAEIQVEDEGGACYDTLKETQTKLKIIKDAPSALVSYVLAKGVSQLPSSVATRLLTFAIGGSCVAISNVRGPDVPLHVKGRKVEQLVGFVPPPPSVPIGVVIMSYNGKITLTLNADKRCVPDADKFVGWVLEEYRKLVLLSLTK